MAFPLLLLPCLLGLLPCLLGLLPNSPNFRSRPFRLSLNSVIGNKFSQGIDILYCHDFQKSDFIEDKVHSKIGKVLSKLGKEVLSTSVRMRTKKCNIGDELEPVTNLHETTNAIESDTNDVPAHPQNSIQSNIIEVTLQMKGGRKIHTSYATRSMPCSIDLISHVLAEQLKRHNKKITKKQKTDNKEEDDVQNFDLNILEDDQLQEYSLESDSIQNFEYRERAM